MVSSSDPLRSETTCSPLASVITSMTYGGGGAGGATDFYRPPPLCLIVSSDARGEIDHLVESLADHFSWYQRCCVMQVESFRRSAAMVSFDAS